MAWLGARHLILLGLVLLGVALYIWARRRRGPSMAPEVARALFESRAGAPMTEELKTAIAVHIARNAYPTQGVIEATYGENEYGVRLVDGTLVRGTPSPRHWRPGEVLWPGQRVHVMALRGSDRDASILRRL
jgi:hypothetical protein